MSSSVCSGSKDKGGISSRASSGGLAPRGDGKTDGSVCDVQGSRYGVLVLDDTADGLRTRLALRKVKKAVHVSGFLQTIDVEAPSGERGWGVFGGEDENYSTGYN